MYESNNGFKEWSSNQLKAKGVDNDSSIIRTLFIVSLIGFIASFVNEYGTIECVQNFSSGVTCSNNSISFNLHRYVPSNTTSSAIWSDIGPFTGRAGIAWTPGEGIKLWSSYFTNGLKEFFLNIP